MMAARWGVAVLLLATLAGCGRDDGRQPDPPLVLPTYTGVLTTGSSFPTANVQVASNGTFPRDRITGPDGRFAAPLAGLSAPFFISGSAADDFGTEVFAITNASSGPVNVTPLTRLVALELARQDLDLYFSRLFTSASIPISARIVDARPFTDANIAVAQATVVRLLRQELGVIVPPTIATQDFVTTPFAAVAGDPMFDTLVALSAATVRDDFTRYPLNRIEELARCAQEVVRVTLAADFYDFCPATRATQADPDDATVLTYTLTNIRGSTISLRLRENSVLAVDLLRDGFTPYRCRETACAFIVVGGEVEDRTRPLSFSNTTLTGDDGSSAMLAGTVIGGIPGLPPLDCEEGEELPLFATGSDGITTGSCADAAVRFAAPASSRAVYRSFDFLPFIEVRIDGSTLLSVTQFTITDDQAEVPLFQCAGSACVGTSLSEVMATESPRSVERTLSFDGTLLTAPGNPEATLRLDGAILLGNRIDSSAPDCSGIPASQTVRARVNGEASDWNVCPPYNLDDGLVGGTIIRDFNIGRFPGAVLGDFLYSFTNEQNGSDAGLIVIASPAGVPRRIEYTRSLGESFACTDAACLAAVSLSVPDRNDARTITITPVTVPEVLLGEQPGDRSVRLDGLLLAAPDRFISGEGD